MMKGDEWHETTIDEIMEGRKDLQTVFHLDGVEPEPIREEAFQSTSASAHYEANLTLHMHPLVFLALSTPLYTHTGGDVYENIHVCLERARLKTQVEIQRNHPDKIPVRPGFWVTQIAGTEFNITHHDHRHRVMVQH